ncbi:hypothetical protein DX914_06995 [Lysobacter silvisoli]|uniref:Teneurin-like YD-shell domain-containing protein n=2 Tax=Lysobacter silvisoli TaxID=2293254 RepID=A0A371K7B2_9GAMM|nr:hypothetical protein DX914_06995 [Lysobacter silvisoli]
MVQDGVGLFGETTQNVAVAVTSGALSATPNPCSIPSGASICSSSVGWVSSASNAQVWVTGLDNSNPQLFAAAKNGSQVAGWITAGGARFHLKSGTLTLDTIDVSGQLAANVPPSVSLTAPVGGQVFPAASSVVLKATASDPDNGVQRVEFYVDGAKVGEDASAPYAVSWTSTAGAHSVTARAIDPLNAQATSSAVAISVSSPPPVATGGVARIYVYNNESAYGADQRLCKVIEPETGATVMRYDTAGNLMWSASGLNLPSTSSCDFAAAHASGRRIDRTYDARSRMVDMVFPDGNGNQHFDYTKDGLPSLIRTWNNEGTTTVVNRYYYNKRRLLEDESVEQPGSYTWPLDYVYDQNGSLAEQAYPTGLRVRYAPNALGQATQVVTAPSSTTTGTYASGVSYYPNGAIKQFTYGNGIVHTMVQNARQLPQTTQDGSITGFTHLYDANGNTTLIDDLVQGQNFKRYLSYDGLDRLKAAGSAMFGGSTHYINYTYDAVDNIRSVNHPGVREHTYWYDARNQLTNVQNPAGASVVGLDYDVQGNINHKNGQEYRFDYGNRLRRVVGKETYRYDGYGRRADVTRDNGSAEVFQYSQSGQYLFSSKLPAGGGQTTHENVYLAGSVIATIDHNWPSNAIIATKYQHTDALGSPVATTDTSGALIERTNYEPYGSAINKTVDGIGYTGHVVDGATALTYMQQRYYDASLGRFLSVDPVAVGAGSGSNFNRYQYANNSPYNFYDPDGRFGCPIPASDLCGKSLEVVRAQDASRYRGEPTWLGRVAGELVDFVPWVGDRIAIHAAIRNPSGPRIFAAAVGLAGPIGDGLGKVIKKSDDIGEIAGTLFHYTDEAGARGILESGKILPDANGRVYLTTDQIAPADASNVLFMGRGGNKGTHVVEVDVRQGVELRAGEQANELIHQGAIRDGRQADLRVRKNEF